jgi:putative flippase GtrA
MVTQGAVAQVGKFGVVGLLNTVIDFSIFNFLSGWRLKVDKIPANICSTTVAMVFSFFANREAVFLAGSGNPVIQAILFFVVTGFGLYVLQTGVLYLLLYRWKWPAKSVAGLLKITGTQRRLSNDLVLRNGAKAGGTVVSLIWNFIMYKYVVFR